MSEENKEELETSQNQLEDEATGENLEGDTSHNDSNVEELQSRIVELEKSYKEVVDKNKQLFERVQKSTIKAKTLEAESFAKDETPATDIDTLKLFSALKDYSESEMAIIARQAKALGSNLIDASKHEDTKILINAYREKVDKDNTTPTPSSRQDASEVDFSNWTLSDIQKLSQNPTKENIEQLNNYTKYMRTRKQG